MKNCDAESLLLYKLQKWFQTECNEDWEHTYGFRLETLDNPGWMFEADLEKNRWAGVHLSRQRIDRNESDWVQFEVEGGKYVACGGVFNLVEMLQRFFEVLDELSTDLNSEESGASDPKSGGGGN